MDVIHTGPGGAAAVLADSGAGIRGVSWLSVFTQRSPRLDSPPSRRRIRLDKAFMAPYLSPVMAACLPAIAAVYQGP